MKYCFMCMVLLFLSVSCDETTRFEEQPVGYFIVDSVYVTSFVDEDIIGRIRTNLDIGYSYHFEKSAGYLKCNEVHSIIHDYNPRLCSPHPMLRVVDQNYEYMFGVWGYSDCSYLEEIEITLIIEGWFEDCPYCDFGCDKCEFLWTKDIVVEVEDRLGD